MSGTKRGERLKPLYWTVKVKRCQPETKAGQVVLPTV
ncbi:hypothetical protein M2404_002279 [Rheinheimera pacifica]|nr:hypothetical protein [Rheinheimera pacifica]